MTRGACRARASVWRKSDRVVTERLGCWVLPVSHTLAADQAPVAVEELSTCEFDQLITGAGRWLLPILHTPSLAQVVRRWLGGGGSSSRYIWQCRRDLDEMHCIIYVSFDCVRVSSHCTA